MKFVSIASIAIAAAALVACGGGGGGGSVSPSPSVGSVTTTTPSPTPSPTATPASISGTAVDYVAGTPLVGFTVTLGAYPNTTTCTTTQTASANPCGVPASPIATATTSATGTFTVPAAAGSTYFVAIGKDATYATLHLRVLAGTNLGTVKITALSADEQAWLGDLNTTRAAIATPTSYANLTVDEYAEELARTESNAVANGTVAYGDATESTYLGTYAAIPNIVYAAAGSVQAVQPDPLGFATTYGTAPTTITLPATARGYQGADAAWTYGEKANCPGGSWQGCTFASNNGHYINISNTADVWAGLGESTNPNATLGGKVYTIILPQS